MTRDEIILASDQYLFPAVFHYYRERLVVERAKDQYVWDADGNQYLDFFGGIVTISVGHLNDRVREKVHEQVDRLHHVSTLYGYAPQAELAKTIASVTPNGELTKSFFTNSGTEANETAILLARCYTGHSEIVALRHGYHGRTALGTTLTGQGTWRSPAVPQPGIVHAHNAYCYRCPFGLEYPSCELRCAKDLEELIQTSTSGQVAGMIAEPIQGVGGFITPPKASSIESKRILIQVIVQVFTAHSALVRPDQPALQQGSHPVNVGQQLGGRLARTGQKVVLVPIAKRLQADVPFPAVGVDRAVGLDSLLDEAVQLLLGRFADALHTDPSYPRAVFLGGDGYQCFFLRLPSAQSLFCAPHIGLVDLHATAEPFSAGPHHRAPQLVQQRPGGTVASQTQDALQSQCAHPVFLAGHPPHGPKPGAQRQARVLENRARRHRSLIIALPTPQQAPPAGPSSPPSTAGTHKTLWPAQLHQILATRLLSGKTPLKLLQRPRVVLHSPACYMLGSRESSAYPEEAIVKS